MNLEISELSRQPLHRQVARQIRSRILSAQLEAEASLEPVRALAREHRVSVACVERAYRELEEQGLIERVDRELYRVAPLEEDQRRVLEKQRLFEDLRRQEFSLRELELARDIQCRLLPPEEVSGEGWTVVSRSEPARFVAGDFHDVIRFPDGSIAVVVADVVGKGIGASLIMASVKAILPFIASDHSPEETVRELNGRLCCDLGRREFVALAFVRYEPSTGHGKLVNAGLPDPILVSKNESPIELTVHGERLPLGLRKTITWTGVEFELTPGDRLLLNTDGIPEATGHDGELIGYEGWIDLINDSLQPHADSPGDWLDALLEALHSRTGSHLDDDLTAVVLERRR